jgi:hypothetical protein
VIEAECLLVSPHHSPIYKSYLKTTMTGFVLAFAVVALAVLSLLWLPALVGLPVAAILLLAGAVATVGAGAGLIVMARYRRGAAGKEDLYVELNRSHSSAAIRTGTVWGASRARRWLAQRMFGHDLLVGDLVEIKSWAEISATLDERGCLEEVPFMPEMVALCGQRARVFRSLHRIFDYRKTRRMRHMDGAVLLNDVVCGGEHHGGCQAACLIAWKVAWLRRVQPSTVAQTPAVRGSSLPDPLPVSFGTQPPQYRCQLTQLSVASKSIDRQTLSDMFRPLVSGNVAPAAFAVGWLTNLFNDVQHWRRGVGFPAFEAKVEEPSTEGPDLNPGDSVVVRSSGEIHATLNDQSLNRGLYFEPDMLKYCGQRYLVGAKVQRIIDIVTGEMRQMKTAAYLLDDVRFTGERQLFNAQHEPLFWRAIWLRRDET